MARPLEGLGNRAVDDLMAHGGHRHHRVPGASVIAQHLRKTRPGISDTEVARHLAVYAANSHPPLSAEEVLRAIRATHWSQVADGAYDDDDQHEHAEPGDDTGA